MSRGRKILEVSISIAFLGTALAVLVEVRDLPPGLIDPLGSAPVPRWTSTLLLLLSLAMLARVLLPSHFGTVPEVEITEDEFPERPRATFGVAALTIVYVLVLSSRAVGYGVLTASFVFALVILLGRGRAGALWIGLLLGTVVGFGCEYLFTQIFVVDLPTWR